MYFTRRWDFTWRVSDCEELVWDEIQLPVQSVIRIFLTKKQSRLESLFPGDCMDNVVLNADKNADKFYLYYSLHGKGNDITETREWGDFLGVCLTVKY